MLAKPSASLVGFAFLAAVIAQQLHDGVVPAPARIAALGASGLGVLLGAISRLAHDARMGVEEIAGFTAWFPLNVLGKHAANALMPTRLSILYPLPSGRPDTEAALGALCVLAAIALAVTLRKRGKGALLLALAAALYLPVSTLFPFGRVMSDSYLYLPLACVAIGVSIMPLSALARGWMVLAMTALSLLSMKQTLREVPRWQGGDALWAHVVSEQPDSILARNLYGDELHFRGESERAVAAYLEAFQIGYDPTRLMHLGAALSMLDRLEDAECVLIEAIVHGDNPGYASFNYGVLLAFHRDYATRYPPIAKWVLTELDALRRTGRAPWPVALEAGLAIRLASLSSVTAQPPRFERRHCSALKLGAPAPRPGGA